RLGVALVEDCAQTLGASLGGRPVGARGGLIVCSFYATKLLTTGEGGAVAGPADLVARARDTRDYDGRTELGPRFNYKMTDMQAALGRSQLPRLGAFIARRRALAARYRAALARAPRRAHPARPGDSAPRASGPGGAPPPGADLGPRPRRAPALALSGHARLRCRALRCAARAGDGDPMARARHAGGPKSPRGG